MATERSAKNTRIVSLLTDLLYDETGDRLCPTHANKKGRRYRYYISQRLVHDAHKHDGGWRLPAKEIETVVTGAVADLLKDPLRLLQRLRLPDASPNRIDATTLSASTLADRIIHGEQTVQRECLKSLVARITLEPTDIRIDVRRASLCRLVPGDEGEYRDRPDDTVCLDIPIRLRRKGAEAKLVITDPAQRRREVDPRLCNLVAKARLWLNQLAAGEFGSVRAIAERLGMHEADVSRALTLAFLAPDIVGAILDGMHPVDLTAETLRRLPNLPTDWNAQRRVLGLGTAR